MTQTPDTAKIKEHLNTLVEHRLFNRSPRIVNLITFLVEESIKGSNLKEDIIGLEVFDKDYTSTKNDGLVRVYIHKLRKKLNEYYKIEGRNAPIVFSLEKGSYRITFLDPDQIEFPTEEKQEEIHNESKTKNIFIFSAIPLLFVILISAFYYFKPKEKNLWTSYFDNSNNNVCILADQFIMIPHRRNRNQFVIETEVNSTEEFIEHIRKNNIDTLRKAGYTYFTKAIPHSIYNLSRWFLQHNAEFASIPESEFRFEDSKRNNLVYIGQQKTMSVSKEIFLKDSKIFIADFDHFVSTKTGKAKHYRAKYGLTVTCEYAMVSYVPLDKDNKAIYFVSDNDIGTMAVVNRFTDPLFIKEFYKNLPSTESYFNALFKVEGIERTDANCELVELEVLN